MDLLSNLTNRKIPLIFLSLCFVGTIQGVPFSEYWNEGAARVGQVQLEPNLSGEELFSSLTNVISTFIDGLQATLYDQFGEYMNYYAGGAAMRSYLLLTALQNTDDTAPSDAFDVMILNHTVFLNEFLFNIKDYLPKTKVLKPLPKLNLGSSLIQPRTKKHDLNDFLSYFDLVLTSDLAMLTSYIDEMLYLGKETILQHYHEYESSFQGGIPTVCGQMERYLETSNANTTKIQLHTSSWIFLNYEKVKDEIAVSCQPKPFAQTNK